MTDSGDETTWQDGDALERKRRVETELLELKLRAQRGDLIERARVERFVDALAERVQAAVVQLRRSDPTEAAGITEEMLEDAKRIAGDHLDA